MTSSRAELEDKIENAVQAMSETHESWKARCFAIMAALGVDFGDHEDMPEYSDIVYGEMFKEYWLDIFPGNRYQPKVNGLHVAGHPISIKKAFDEASDECKDVIAALIWRLRIAENRSEFFINELKLLDEKMKEKNDEV